MTKTTTTNRIQTEREQQQEQDEQREIYLDHTAKLEAAWKELDDERNKVNKLDIEVAHLKDELSRQRQVNEALVKTFNEIYSMYQQLYDQVINSNTALAITVGKNAESLVKFKFTLPQQEQPSL